MSVPVTFTRMCYYSDVVDGDWVFDYCPKYSSLLFATGGAGHAFKVGQAVTANADDSSFPSLVT